MIQTDIQKKQEKIVLWCTMITLFIGYCILSACTGGKMWKHQWQDSYSLQALNWLQGRMWILDGENYTWLELAVFKGKYWCSFPPIPSVVMLPLVVLFGEETPNTLMVAIYGMISVALAYKIMLKLGRKPLVSAFWAVFLVWGSNILWMTTDGGVWFQAQDLAMLFCLAGILNFLYEKKGWSLFFIALAVGCRPFSAVFIPVFLFIWAWREKEENGFLKALGKQGQYCFGMILVALALMAYNYVRFGNPLEFGHNYLPEFVEAENGQFNVCYLWPNLKTILFEPVRIKDGKLDFPIFNGFMFYVANPLFLVLFYEQIRALVRNKITAEGIGITIGLILELILLCMHKTFGGWQFGCRYTCDLLPFAFLYIGMKGKEKPNAFMYIVSLMAVLFNIYGVFYMYNYG